MDLPFEQLAAKYQSAPLEIRLALSSEDFTEKIFSIGEEHKLMLDQSDALSEIVALTMLGVTPRTEFHDKVAALGVSDEAVNAITRDINAQIFEPLRAAFREMEDENATREDILSEIENPSPSVFRTELVIQEPSLAEAHNAKVLGSEKPDAELKTEDKREGGPALPPVIDPSHELAAPETSVPRTEPAPIPPPPPAEPPKPVSPPPAAAPITEAPRRVTEIKPELRPPVRRSVDPYREPIE